MSLDNHNRLKNRFETYLDGLPLASRTKPSFGSQHAGKIKILGLVAVVAGIMYFLKEPTEPVPLPANGAVTWHQSRSGKTVPFTFESSTFDADTNYYVRLVQEESNEPVLSMFVRAGQKASVQAPIGSYRLFVAEGSTWYGVKRLFGHGTRVTEGLESIELTYDPRTRQSMGRIVSYRKRLDGNYPTHPAGKAAFD